MADRPDQTWGGNARLEQRRRAAQRANDRGDQGTEEVLIAQDTATERENREATTEVCDNRDLRRNFRYPLQGVDTAPARIIFAVHKIKPLFDLDEKVDASSRDRSRELTALLNTDENAEEGEEEQGGVAEFFTSIPEVFQSYDNVNADNEFGRVTLPLFKALPFNDNVSYNTANLGVLANAGNLGEVDMQGRLGAATQAVAMNMVGKTAVQGATTGVGRLAEKFLPKNLGGGVGTLAGFVAGAGLGENLGAVTQNATRVTTSPNERTMFEKVNLRTHSFSFKMIARNEAELAEIKNIVQFFREEVYPEAITVVDGGPPFAYEFPNVFKIEVLNRLGNRPAPKFGRCYLESVQTTFNSTATGMYNAEDFMEVDIALSFKEISALHKGLVRDEGY